jgi:hypothetical protein
MVQIVINAMSFAAITALLVLLTYRDIMSIWFR